MSLVLDACVGSFENANHMVRLTTFLWEWASFHVWYIFWVAEYGTGLALSLKPDVLFFFGGAGSGFEGWGTRLRDGNYASQRWKSISGYEAFKQKAEGVGSRQAGIIFKNAGGRGMQTSSQTSGGFSGRCRCHHRTNNQKDYARALQTTHRQLFFSCRECLFSESLLFLLSTWGWVKYLCLCGGIEALPLSSLAGTGRLLRIV